MPGITIRDGDSFEAALKKFKKLISSRFGSFHGSGARQSPFFVRWGVGKAGSGEQKLVIFF